MRRVLCAISLGVLILGLAAASAQTGTSDPADTRVVNGVVKSTSAYALTIEDREGAEMTFAILKDSRFAGLGHARDLLLRKPEPSPFVAILKTGDEVKVSYHTSGSRLEAVEVRQLRRPQR